MSSQEARDAGRGVFFIAGAKIYFIIAGFAIEVIALPNLLGASVFGAYALVASMVSPVNNVLVTGTIQAVSRFTAQTRERVAAIQRGAQSPVLHSLRHDASP